MLFATESNVLALLKKHYNIVADRISKVSGYANVNYLIRIGTKECMAKSEGKTETRYIVKIADKSHELYCGSTELQHTMMRLLNTHGILASQPILTSDRKTFLECVTEESEFTVQVLTFIGGQSLTEATISADEYSIISHEIGSHLGRFHEIMKDIKYDPLVAAPKVPSPFQTENAMACKNLICHVEDAWAKELITNHLDLFESNFLPKIPELRKTFLHGDFSDSNVIVERSGDGWKVKGVIDFEDCYHGCAVADLGICVAYCMMKSASIPDSNPVEVSGCVVRAYESMMPLTAVEKEVLFEVVLSRLCVSYVYSCYLISIRPEDREYLLSQAKHVPRVFSVIKAIGRKKIEKEWFGK